MGKFEYKHLNDIKNLLLIFRCDNVICLFRKLSFLKRYILKYLGVERT